MRCQCALYTLSHLASVQHLDVSSQVSFNHKVTTGQELADFDVHS